MQHFHTMTDMEVEERFAEGRETGVRLKELDVKIKRLNELLPNIEKAIQVLPVLERKNA